MSTDFQNPNAIAMGAVNRSQGGSVEKTDAEWHEFCRPFVFMNGSHEMPNYPAICRAVLALAAPASAQEALRAAIDGLTDYAPHHSGNGMQRGGKYVLRSDVLAALAAIRSPSAAVQQGEALTDWLDGQEFHELCMDYRGANIRNAREAFERLQEGIERAALASAQPKTGEV